MTDQTSKLKAVLLKNKKPIVQEKQVGHKWVELIVFSTGKVTKCDQNKSPMIAEKFTYEHRVLFRSDDPLVVLEYSDANKVNPDTTQLNHNIVIKLQNTIMEIVSPAEAELIYDKLKQTIIGKGNNYVVIKDGKVTSETIPFKVKEKNEDNKDNQQ